MADNQEFELEITEKASQLLEEFAKKINKPQEEVIEYVLAEFLQNQLGSIQRIAKETDQPVNELVSRQFEKILETLNNKV
ncbi:MAG: hypothetical protein H0Z40_02340 [Desulfotomaculum sp.]|nr:hypothetical protein [Desulfotomaculum sp.]